MSWTIQSNTDNGAYVTLEVVPALQGTDGVHTFAFELTPRRGPRLPPRPELLAGCARGVRVVRRVRVVYDDATPDR